jgi:hypothetical protein
MPVTNIAKVRSSSDKTTHHQIKRGKDGRVYCTCKGWRYSRPAFKTCKHLEQYYATLPYSD